MKTRLIGLLLVAFFILSLTTKTYDDCQPYFPLVKGTTWVYNEFDKKGELSTTNTTIVENVISSGEKIEFKLKAISDGPKKKEKNHTETEIVYSCENGVFKMNLDNLIPQETMDSFGEEVTVNMEQSELEFPTDMVAGETLKDASIKVSISMGSITMMNMDIQITDRKIEKLEEVTTEAGTYSCALLTYNVATNMGVKMKSSSKDWYSKEVGIVKSETYDKNGNLQGSRSLVSYKSGN
jgi:DUF3108-like